jgi:hypothetical protein
MGGYIMAQISEMLSQSRTVITQPSVSSFEKYEKQGGLQDALIYMVISAGITGLLGLGNGLGGLVAGVLSTLLGFLIFTYLVFWIGKQQGGTGTLDEVAYTFALFWAPLSVLGALAGLILLITVIGIVFIPILGIAILAANIYFSYLAVQSSMNMPTGGKTWLTLVLAALGAGIASFVLSGLLTR